MSTTTLVGTGWDQGQVTQRPAHPPEVHSRAIDCSLATEENKLSITRQQCFLSQLLSITPLCLTSFGRLDPSHSSTLQSIHERQRIDRILRCRLQSVDLKD